MSRAESTILGRPAMSKSIQVRLTDHYGILSLDSLNRRGINWRLKVIQHFTGSRRVTNLSQEIVLGYVRHSGQPPHGLTLLDPDIKPIGSDQCLLGTNLQQTVQLISLPSLS